MLTSDLLIYRYQGESLVPKALSPTPAHLQMAQTLITTFASMQGRSRHDLDQTLQDLEGDQTDYRIKRGLAHLLSSSFSTFETVSPMDPVDLRQLVFSLSAQGAPAPQKAPMILEHAAQQLTQSLGVTVEPHQVQSGLYADLKENQILVQFEAPTPEALLHRYNLAQVQGLFYRAYQVVIDAYRNDPGEYKLLFRYIKLFSLMAYIEGQADHGFTITLDGPTSLFQASTRYGLALAKLIPALLHVTKWRLTATLNHRDSSSQTTQRLRYSLNSDTALQSHYPPGKPFDSLIEEQFYQSWSRQKTDWVLEREVDLIPLPGSVMIPDFRLVHPTGKTYLLEIVGYWRPDYLKKKFAQVQKANRTDLILAVSDRLNLEKAGVNWKQVNVPIVWFKQKLSPRQILDHINAASPEALG
ncbi:DUF790 family protein [Lyngbya confervoides]|uniref:DUF790 family protein n=1 Tax=Lyngbya confervoides BDU141951 TaxID=1574623 RepID=A0ABD4T771_9CYAN|nr:DUF790 family protein [Lyngbya confervoides]MCM1984132.1 DUF790 family protein [Lyngbya confervoides BDU141951]